MDNLVIKDMKVVPLVVSNFVKPTSVLFNQNGVDRSWDFITVHDCVAVLLLNKTRNAFLLVKQFRPDVYMHTNRTLNKANKETTHQDLDDSFVAPVSDGVTYELCAGIVDKDVPLSSIIKQEVLEECGYDVPEERFEKMFISRGVEGGPVHTMFYAEVTDSMIVGDGGGNRSEGEEIELMYLPKEEVQDFLFNETLPKPTSLIAAFFWYLHRMNKSKNV